MKTTKLTAIAIAIVFAATASMAQSESPTDKTPGIQPKTITIELRKAIQDRGLVNAMHTQLDARFLQVDRPIYNAPVRYKRSTVIVTGTYSEWNKFFYFGPDRALDIDDGTHISLKLALENKELTRAMHEQLTPDMLRKDQPSYTAAVKLRHSVIFVTASLSEWKRFFNTDNTTSPLEM
jgi:hypothetical protein